MSTAELKKRREKLRGARDDAERAAHEKATELDVLERERARLKDRLEELKGKDPKTEERIATVEAKIQAVQADLQTNHRRAEFSRDRLDALDSATEKLTKRIKSLSRRIRNRIKPKITDLHMSAGSVQPYITGSVGHYTAGPLARTDEEAVRMWWQVRAQHLNQGWAGIGYNVGIGPEGGIYILRGVNRIGAHTLNNNTGRVGFSVHGTTGHTWTKAQKRAFRYALKKFGLIDKPVHGHNDFMATACPGSFKNGYVSKGK